METEANRTTIPLKQSMSLIRKFQRFRFLSTQNHHFIHVTTIVQSSLNLCSGNHPYNWEANSTSDAALSILLNLCYTQSVRSALKEVDTFQTLISIAEYSAKLNETRNPAEESQMTSQCLKAVRNVHCAMCTDDMNYLIPKTTNCLWYCV